MKHIKQTIAALLLAAGTTGTANAAANPFSDVPADHWAYEAVNELAHDNILEGYGDTTFRGGQIMTRYEMAQLVGRAMAKETHGADRALVEKLAAEFHDELKGLGVRVTELERNSDKVLWKGQVEYTFDKANHQSHANAETENSVTFRLEPVAKVNEHWDVHSRLDMSFLMNLDGEGLTAAGIGNGSTKMQLKRVWAEGHYGNTTLKIGKLPNDINIISVTDDPYSGAFLRFGQTLQVTLEAGRINAGNFDSLGRIDGRKSSPLDASSAVDMQAIDLALGQAKRNVHFGYQHLSGLFKDTDWAAWYTGSNSDHDFKANFIFANGYYRFHPNFGVKLQYSHNTSAQKENKAGSIELQYKGASLQDVGSWGGYVAYRNLGQGSAVWGTYGDVIGNGQKGWEIGATYTFAPNMQFVAKYGHGSNRLCSPGASEHYTKFHGNIEIYF